ncbi:N-acetylmuramoyl-L-alanine amidase [Ornithinibacillus californiensis]|uniref:N-acetylmuramoyl-L-alanine amidase n=1 Tax=Ornithinibacillus californiensis TaxID=161536 RepID=UPI00064DB816|nr:N-acetylmuramoyl-L-alanine amidase [Ornithinibacillus californiensis]
MKLKRVSICLLILLLFPIHLLSAQEILMKSEVEVKRLHLPYSLSAPRNKEITHIVIHSFSNVAINPEHPYRIIDLYLLLMQYGVSTHYVIDRDGDIFQLVPEQRIAFHAGKSGFPYVPFFPHNMNDFSIGIELMGIGAKGEMVPIISAIVYDSLDSSLIGFTEKQYDALTNLLEDLHRRYPTIPNNRLHVIGHEDYAPGRKMDPGSLFDWRKLGYE